MSAEQLVVLGIVERTVWWRWQRQKRDGMDLGGVRRGEVKTVNTELSVNDTGNEENERTWPLLKGHTGLGSSGGRSRGRVWSQTARVGRSFDPRLESSVL